MCHNVESNRDEIIIIKRIITIIIIVFMLFFNLKVTKFYGNFLNCVTKIILIIIIIILIIMGTDFYWPNKKRKLMEAKINSQTDVQYIKIDYYKM